MIYRNFPGVCVACEQHVPDVPSHYVPGVCAVLDDAMPTRTNAGRSAAARASRGPSPAVARRPYQRPNWRVCSRCGGGPRVSNTSYCRPCRRAVLAESAARCRARAEGERA